MGFLRYYGASSGRNLACVMRTLAKAFSLVCLVIFICGSTLQIISMFCWSEFCNFAVVKETIPTLVRQVDGFIDDTPLDDDKSQAVDHVLSDPLLIYGYGIRITIKRPWIYDATQSLFISNFATVWKIHFFNGFTQSNRCGFRRANYSFNSDGSRFVMRPYLICGLSAAIPIKQKKTCIFSWFQWFFQPKQMRNNPCTSCIFGVFDKIAGRQIESQSSKCQYDVCSKNQKSYFVAGIVPIYAHPLRLFMIVAGLLSGFISVVFLFGPHQRPAIGLPAYFMALVLIVLAGFF